MRGRKRRDDQIERLTTRIFEVMAWLTPADRPAVQCWARLEYLSDHVWRALKDRGLFNEDHQLVRLADDFRKIASTQLSYSTALGFTPASRRMIRPDLAAESVNLESVNSALVSRQDTAAEQPNAPTEASHDEPQTSD
jgi:hypothetical protein